MEIRGAICGHLCSKKLRDDGFDLTRIAVNCP